ncbi:glycolate oxidase subunit GlcE [Starkeya sp. ORNL1]|uniref:glycolate oxidase subunit GlcE n=1 Tax=Starkeya sp. ORNL1 TaxID=2709380 RepID=UPI0014643416|nr:glycolate oxidase subunit GlcE [Starkeya sp. ORNL1]QJP15366.1 glycolate oxidase subunit GlcE [Starkeya sp. ORNL1]
MTDRLRPRDEAELVEVVRWAVSEGRTLEVAGAGSKRTLGRHIQTDATLDLSALSGVTLYEPEELVLSARAGTPLIEIEAQLKEARQMLAFEPMDFGPLLGGPRGAGTLGGLMACNLAGPRRPSAGAARDHALGLRAVSGRGEAFKAGGRVVKNVTGYDLPRGLSGSYGTLAAYTELTIKVLPRPETAQTLLILGLDDATAAKAMSAAVGSYYDVSGAAHLPADIAARVPAVAAVGRAVTALRLEGVPPSIRHRRAKLEALLGPFGALSALEAETSELFWMAVRDVLPFADGVTKPVWRVSTAPMQGAAIGAAARNVGGTAFYDWAGGLVWIELPDAEPRAELIRAAVRASGGHATLIRASADRRAATEVFQPLDPITGALVRRMKESFDPSRVLNPGRMYAGM